MCDIYEDPAAHMPRLFEMSYQDYHGDEKVREKLLRAAGYVMRFDQETAELVSGAIIVANRIIVAGVSKAFPTNRHSKLDELTRVQTIANQCSGAEWVSIGANYERVKEATKNAGMDRIVDPVKIDTYLGALKGKYETVCRPDGTYIVDKDGDNEALQEVWAWDTKCVARVHDGDALVKPYEVDGSWCFTAVRLTQNFNEWRR